MVAKKSAPKLNEAPSKTDWQLAADLFLNYERHGGLYSLPIRVESQDSIIVNVNILHIFVLGGFRTIRFM
jgi:hypothetical protein